MMKTICAMAIVAALLMPVGVSAASPRQTVESHVTQLLAVLNDKTLGSDPAGEEKKKAAIRPIADSLFDFTELSRFALGAGWRRFNPEQQKTFVDLYRELLESIYMGRLLQYKEEKVVFKKEAALSETRYEVQSDIISAGGNIPINYRLVTRQGQWKVYDLVIENASLAKNYRAQFNSILQKNTPEKLIEILREKVKAQKAAN